MQTETPLPANVDNLRVALVHDWLTGMRGGEKALVAIQKLLPQADIFTLLHVPGSVSNQLESAISNRSFIQFLPRASTHYRRYIPLFPIAIEQFDFDEYDLVVSTSHCVAKSVVTPGRTLHLCYCFTPMRYAWDQFDAYFSVSKVGSFKHYLYRLLFSYLARWDRNTAVRPNHYIAISQHVAERIQQYYNRASSIVYPPVDTQFYNPNGLDPQSYLLIVSALVPYKRIDLAITACQLAGVKLKIVGVGPDRPGLEAKAGSETEFLGSCSDNEVRELYQSARAVILPGEEDFGIAPVEGLACGRPVVALAKGGALETVENGLSGILVEEATTEAFAEAISKISTTKFDPNYIRQQSLRFSMSRFYDKMRTSIESLVKSPNTETLC